MGEIKTVVNISGSNVNVLFDGMQHIFEPGQERDYIESVAEAIANESPDLAIMQDQVEDSEVAEEPKKKSKKKEEEVKVKGIEEKVVGE